MRKDGTSRLEAGRAGVHGEVQAAVLLRVVLEGERARGGWGNQRGSWECLIRESGCQRMEYYYNVGAGHAVVGVADIAVSDYSAVDGIGGCSIAGSAPAEKRGSAAVEWMEAEYKLKWVEKQCRCIYV